MFLSPLSHLRTAILRHSDTDKTPEYLLTSSEKKLKDEFLLLR